MAEFRSEIRDSQIDALAAKAASGSYGKYLKRIVLKKVRSFENRDVTLDFPVTALVGPNGGGKTTILGAAGPDLSRRRPEPLLCQERWLRREHEGLGDRVRPLGSSI